MKPEQRIDFFIKVGRSTKFWAFAPVLRVAVEAETFRELAQRARACVRDEVGAAGACRMLIGSDPALIDDMTASPPGPPPPLPVRAR